MAKRDAEVESLLRKYEKVNEVVKHYRILRGDVLLRLGKILSGGDKVEGATMVKVRACTVKAHTRRAYKYVRCS